MWEVKGWRDSWTVGRGRLGLLSPQGYTRIGPAIRHATAELLGHEARRKHMILITDAKPTDFDRYEGRHGIHDVRQAVREATVGNIGVHALGIDPKCAGILPVMFGVRGWKLLRSITDLPEALVAAYGELG
jgi:nitric oxide reductase NorD protein